MGKKIAKGTILFLVVLVLFALCAIKRSPKQPYEINERAFYKQSIENVNQAESLILEDSIIKAGWSKVNITPEKPYRVIGYGFNKHFESVMDSLFVRSVVFSDGEKRVAYLSFDLLLVHPNVVDAIENKLKDSDIPVDAIYYTATHTHTGFGGFANGAASYFVLGGFHRELLDSLSNQAINAIKKSIEKEQNVEVAYGEVEREDRVRNRVIDNGNIDPYLRFIRLKNKLGKEAGIVSYAAHAASLFEINDPILSADYPGEMIRILEKEKGLDFVMFGAGGVGSHNARVEAYFPKNMKAVGRDLADTIYAVWENVELKPLQKVSYTNVALGMQRPLMRIDSTWAIRSWAFQVAFGSLRTPYLRRLDVNETSFIGTPCDFSGELGVQISSSYKEKSHPVIINSFNGGYVGYITPDEYYFTQRHREFYELNWYGYGNGAYFSEIITRLLDKK